MFTIIYPAVISGHVETRGAHRAEAFPMSFFCVHAHFYRRAVHGAKNPHACKCEGSNI